jgi:RNA polymerase sigma factor (sigma-70 family)
MKSHYELSRPSPLVGLSADWSLKGEAFLSCLRVINDVTAQVCRRHCLSADESEDFQSEVRRHFVQRDFERLRRFERRSSLQTYLIVVICRLFLDYRTLWGVRSPVVSPEAVVVRADHDVLAARVQLALDRAREALEPEERLILKMRLKDRLSIADIARALHRDQKRLYRVLERLQAALGQRLEADGISRDDVSRLFDD